MVVIAARFAGKCRRCGRPIQPGSQMEWTKAGGALHLTLAECEAAPAVLQLREAQPELPGERERAERLLLSHPWKAATSEQYKKLPHEYTLRKNWDAAEFEWVAQHIRATGYEQQFIGRVWTYYDVGEHQYWTMGNPLSETTLINRAVKKPSKRPLTPTLGFE